MPKCRDDSGQAIVLVALAMVVILGFLGLGLDFGYLRVTRRQLQRAADAAAIAGAAEISYCGGTNNCTALQMAAQDGLTENGLTSSSLFTQCATSSGTLTVTVNNPPCALGASDPHNGDAKYVEAVVSQKTPVAFARIFGITAVTVTARGEATLGSSKNCFYALDPSKQGAVDVSGGSALNISGCGMYVDSDNAQAVEATGSGSISALSIKVVGSYYTHGAGSISPTPTTGAASAADPLAYIPKPSYTPCASSTAQLSIGSTTHQTIPSGSYCGGISIGNSAVVNFSGGNYVVAKGIQIGGNATVTFAAGTYILQGGGFSAGNSAQVTGSGVLFYLTGDTNFPYGPVTISGNANVQLVAPTSGTYTGILFYQDSSANGATSANSGNASSFGGSSSSYFQGALYFPTTGITYGGGSSAQYTIIDADYVTLGGSATINSDYSTLSGGSPVKGPGSGAVLVE